MWSESNPPLAWIKGELLNVRKYSDGQYRITRLDEEYVPERENGLILRYDECQAFVSQWYAPTARAIT